MDRSFVIICSAVFLVCLASDANAAALRVSHGEVLLNRGGGYRAVRSTTVLGVGDTVVSKAGSTADIVFADDCRVRLRIGMIFTVGAQSPCELAGVHGHNPGAAQLSHTDGAFASAENSWRAGTETLPAVEEAQVNVWPYVLGAAAVGGIAAAASGFGGGDSVPISP
jgi:hypothetical protein